MSFPVHTIESAPEGSKESLRGLQEALGVIPNLAATMAGSPTLIRAFVAAFTAFNAASLGPVERQILLLTNGVTNQAPWAVAFHSIIARSHGAPAADVDRIRQGGLPATSRLAALSATTRKLIETRGQVGEEDFARLQGAGFEQTVVLEIIAGLAVSAMANYAAKVTDPPLEPAFAAQRWAPAAATV